MKGKGLQHWEAIPKMLRNIASILKSSKLSILGFFTFYSYLALLIAAPSRFCDPSWTWCGIFWLTAPQSHFIASNSFGKWKKNLAILIRNVSPIKRAKKVGWCSAQKGLWRHVGMYELWLALTSFDYMLIVAEGLPGTVYDLLQQWCFNPACSKIHSTW